MNLNNHRCLSRLINAIVLSNILWNFKQNSPSVDVSVLHVRNPLPSTQYINSLVLKKYLLANCAFFQISFKRLMSMLISRLNCTLYLFNSALDILFYCEPICRFVESDFTRQLVVYIVWKCNVPPCLLPMQIFHPTWLTSVWDRNTMQMGLRCVDKKRPKTVIIRTPSNQDHFLAQARASLKTNDATNRRVIRC